MRGSGSAPAGARETIGPGAGADDRVSGLGCAVRVLDAQRSRAGAHRGDFAARRDSTARLAHVLRVGKRERLEIDDAGAGHMQRGDPARVWLDLLDPHGVEAAYARDAVGGGAALELVQPRKLAWLGGDDQLPAGLHRDGALGAVGVELARALHAQARLERAGGVVNAGVHHARVVARLV